MPRLAALFAVALFCAVTHSLLLSTSTVVYGPQSRELLLLTSKVAARRGIDTSFICATGAQEGCRRLLYGDDYAKRAIDEEGCAKPVSEGVDIQTALQKADSMVIICHDQPLEAKAIATMLNVAASEDERSLSKIVLLSKMGITKAKGGGGIFGGMGGGIDAKISASESALAKIAQERNIPLSIVRAGVLKGGGSPYRPENDDVQDGVDGIDFNFGLNGAYYNTIFDIVEANVAMAYDKYTLGANCVRGDPIMIPNVMSIFGTKSSFEPHEYETSRIVVAEAVVAMLMDENAAAKEFSVSSAKANKPPTPDEWISMLEKI